jgi:hypothetical protein
MLGENPALFPGGWFVESLFIQTLILHVIRTHKILVLQCRHWSSGSRQGSVVGLATGDPVDCEIDGATRLRVFAGLEPRLYETRGRTAC